MNQHPITAAPRTGIRSLALQCAVAAALAGTAAMSIGFAAFSHAEPSAAESAIARCDRMAQLVASRNRASSGDARTAQWRRERAAAFAACLEDPERFTNDL